MKHQMFWDAVCPPEGMQILLLPVSVRMKCEIENQGAKQPDVD